MSITIEPFTVNANLDRDATRAMGENKPITYWGIFFEGENISYTSSKELAEHTKAWMEKWLNLKH